jgi:hypothetical protein
MGQVCAAAFLALALAVALGARSALASGVALAIAMLGRPHMAFAGLALLAIALCHQQDAGQPLSISIVLKHALAIGLPMLVSAGALLGYNAARFGDFRDFGYLTQNIAQELRADLSRYGQFDLHYVPKNLWVMLFAGPTWDVARNRPIPTVEGMSVLLTMPALFLLPMVRKPRLIVAGLLASAALVLLPSVTYYNTGWWQFGYRFFLDITPLIVLLLALATRPSLRRPLRLLIAAGIAMNAWGTWWFLNDLY